jgi:cell division cycle protein 37
MEKASQRMKMLERDLKKIQKQKEQDDSDDDDDDLDDAEAIRIELEELKQQNRSRQDKLDEYEKNKKWNVDNMCEVKEERTVINASAGTTNYTPSGFAQSTVTGEEVKKQWSEPKAEKSDGGGDDSNKEEAKPAAKEAASKPDNKPAPAPAAAKPIVGPAPPKAKGSPPNPSEVDSDPNFVYSYHEFTEKYSNMVEEFMALKSFDESKEFLLKHGETILQEHASNYLLLASLEDEMNGYREKMKQTAKQSQIVTNIAELAKTWNTHPGNVIAPFFQRLQQREFLEGFLSGLDDFIQKIIGRAVTKKVEMDQAQSSGVEKEGVDLKELSKEERLGPGGLDPLEVIETLPIELQEAFESRDVEQLKEVLLKMDQKDAEYHMKRCVASGLWQAG